MWTHGVVEAVLEEKYMAKQYIYHIPLLHEQPSGQVLMLTLRSYGFCPQPGPPKDYKNGTHRLPAWHSAFGVGLAGVKITR